jgi:hypothetical protein
MTYNHYVSVCLSTQKTPKKMNVLDISDTESEELSVAMIEKSVNTIQTLHHLRCFGTNDWLYITVYNVEFNVVILIVSSACKMNSTNRFN